MGKFNIFFIMAYTNLLFFKVYSLENIELNRDHHIEQKFKNALNSVLEYCNRKYELKDTMHNNVKNLLASNTFKNINFTTSLCQLIGKETNSVSGIESDILRCRISSQLWL